jgi:hypothetical protein
VRTSDYIAKLARARGLNATRSTIQAFGTELVSTDVRSFTEGFLADSSWTQGRCLIVDGARQLSFYHELVRKAGQSHTHLVYLETPMHARVARVDAREGMTREELRTFDAHPVEVEVPRFRQLAGLILSGLDSADDLASKVLDWLVTLQRLGSLR